MGTRPCPCKPSSGEAIYRTKTQGTGNVIYQNVNFSHCLSISLSALRQFGEYTIIIHNKNRIMTENKSTIEENMEMTRVRVENFSISLDGYGAGPDQNVDNPLGVGGEDMHDWV